jgi:hypothetical protein
LIINASKRHIQQLNKAKGTASAPDAIEVYDATVGLYRDIHTEYPCFASSASKSSRDLDTLKVFTLMDRSQVEAMGLLPEDYGTEYTPQYLGNQQENQQYTSSGM